MNTAANARPDRIVVVDDDARIRDLLRRYLTQEGFEVLLAEDAKALNRVLTRDMLLDFSRGPMAELTAGCLARKVKIHQIGPGAIRCVTHKDVDREDIDRALDAFREITATW